MQVAFLLSAGLFEVQQKPCCLFAVETWQVVLPLSVGLLQVKPPSLLCKHSLNPLVIEGLAGEDFGEGLAL